MVMGWLALSFVLCAGLWNKFTPNGQFADYGCEFMTYPSARLGYLTDTDLVTCQSACRNSSVLLAGGSNNNCGAVEWNDQSGWCNLYTTLCDHSFAPSDTAIWDGMPRSWYRYMSDSTTSFSLRCTMPKTDPGSLHCVMASGINCQWQSVGVPYGEVANPTQTYANGGVYIQCPNGGVSGYDNGLREYGKDPCAVLGCKSAPAGNGFQGYRFIPPPTSAPTPKPSFQPSLAPSRPPTTPLPTVAGATVAPTPQPTTGIPSPSPTSSPSTRSPVTSSPSMLPTAAPTDGTCAVDIPSWTLLQTNCPRQMLSGSSCELSCPSTTNQRERSFINCTQGILSPISTFCNLTSAPPNTNASHATLSFSLDFTLGCRINASDPGDVALVLNAFAQNIARDLNILNVSAINLTAYPTPDSKINFTLELRDRPPNSTALEDSQTIVTILNDPLRRSNFLLFYFFVNDTVCVTQGKLLHFDLSFDSLLQYLIDLLANLPSYGVAIILITLAILIVWVPYSQRNSPHPFVVLMCLLSMFSLASRIYFIVFVFQLASMATKLDSSLVQLHDVYMAAAAFLGISLALNSIASLLLFIGLRASSTFQKRWFELHPISVAFGICICVFNPGNILILRSHVGGLEGFSAPFPLEHLRRLELIGVVCALIGDLPPLVLTIFTMFIVQQSSVVEWKQTILSLILPVVFSGIVILVSLFMRGCRIRNYTSTLKSRSNHTSMVELEKTVD